VSRPGHRCRGCGADLGAPFLDLGPTPLANSYLKAEELDQAEPFYPLQVHVCEACFLVQLIVVQTPEAIFGDYAYFSSYSTTWLRHAAEFAKTMGPRLALDSRSLVMEVASNDGYLLRAFREEGVPVLGIEPAKNVAVAAEAAGIPTVVEFFGVQLARELAQSGRQADLLVANNVLAHVPALEDFVEGLRIALKPRGVLTVEVPHLLRLMAENQFDTIYHEHFSYFSLAVVSQIFARHGLSVVDVDELTTHGGSLRIHARHRNDLTQAPTERVAAVIAAEERAGLMTLGRYHAFAEQVRETKRALLDFLIGAKRKGHSIVGYGAPAKGNTLLNYCGVRTDFIDYTVDRSPHKQGRYLPGTRIPIYPPERIAETKPDYVLILPWNLREEIAEQMASIRDWGGRFIVPVPRVEVF
jgi:2-polyprenyl-3-methyl-5-hydroxy-6-metoxy-1,4-benzoquinol methylase